MRKFIIQITSEEILTEEQLYPDGVPENFTEEDVRELIDDCGNERIISQWNLDCDIVVEEIKGE